MDLFARRVSPLLVHFCSFFWSPPLPPPPSCVVLFTSKNKNPSKIHSVSTFVRPLLIHDFSPLFLCAPPPMGGRRCYRTVLIDRTAECFSCIRSPRYSPPFFCAPKRALNRKLTTERVRAPSREMKFERNQFSNRVAICLWSWFWFRCFFFVLVLFLSYPLPCG